MSKQQARYRPSQFMDHRTCRYAGCERKTVRGHAFCDRHAVSKEAVEYYDELKRAAAYFDFALQSLDPDQIERSEAFHRFRRRVQRGDFNRLLDGPVQALIEQAAARDDFTLELGVLRFALVRAVAEETDPSRMGVTIARLSNAIARITTAREGQRAARDSGSITEAERLAERFLAKAVETMPRTKAHLPVDQAAAEPALGAGEDAINQADLARTGPAPSAAPPPRREELAGGRE
jgi:hypothetical protein